MLKLESLGSYWWIDEQRKTYVRTPKIERQRESPTDGAGTVLADLKTFPYVKLEMFEIDLDNFWSNTYNRAIVGVVRIHVSAYPRNTPLGRGSWVHLPMTHEQYELAKETLDGRAILVDSM